MAVRPYYRLAFRREEGSSQTPEPDMSWRPGRYYSNLCNSLLLILCVLCLNVAILSLIGHYNVRIGPFHLTAHALFKPILMMNSWFILALMVCGALPPNSIHAHSEGLENPKFLRGQIFFTALIPLAVLAIYCTSAQINFQHHDWTHRHISAGLNSFHAILRLFTAPQADGFYRPLTFISLWLDYRVFGSWYPGYHVQSIALHVINSLLVVRLAGMFRFNRRLSFWAGLLYSAAAVQFEPVLWPAARFDLLATGFTLGALILALRYFSVAARFTWELPTSLLCFVIAVMNKESGYSFPLLILFMLSAHGIWSVLRPAKGKAVLYVILIAIISTGLVLVRLAVYGGLGGYPAAGAPESVHFKLGLRTIPSLLRVLPLTIFGVNTSSAAPAWLPIVVIFFAVFTLTVAIACRGCFRRRESFFVVCAYLAAIPVLNIAGWIGPSMLHSRYLYMPAIFSILLLVSVIGRIHRAGLFLGIFFLLNAAGALANIWSYRDMLHRSESIAETVHMDWSLQPGIKTICVANLPENADGVFFFGPELIGRLEKKIPDAQIIRVQSGDLCDSQAPAGLIYRWSDEDRILRLVRK